MAGFFGIPIVYLGVNGLIRCLGRNLGKIAKFRAGQKEPVGRVTELVVAPFCPVIRAGGSAVRTADMGGELRLRGPSPMGGLSLDTGPPNKGFGAVALALHKVSRLSGFKHNGRS